MGNAYLHGNAKQYVLNVPHVHGGETLSSPEVISNLPPHPNDISTLFKVGGALDTI